MLGGSLFAILNFNLIVFRISRIRRIRLLQVELAQLSVELDYTNFIESYHARSRKYCLVAISCPIRSHLACFAALPASIGKADENRKRSESLPTLQPPSPPVAYNLTIAPSLLEQCNLLLIQLLVISFNPIAL
jgi:hypothetical protein